MGKGLEHGSGRRTSQSPSAGQRPRDICAPTHWRQSPSAVEARTSKWTESGSPRHDSGLLGAA
eukprot:4703138-Prymnesium_polylepis.1